MKSYPRVGALLMACALCLGAAKPDAREAKMLASLQLDADAKVEYFDQAGKAISFDAFFAQVMKGKSFGYEHEGRRAARIRLDPPKALVPAAPRKPPVSGHVASEVSVGDAFPAFSLPSTKGGRVGNAALRGRLTLVNFFFADCVPCVAEIPALNAYARHYPEVQVLALTFDDLARAKGFVKQRGLRWPVLAEGTPLISAAGVTSFPTFALIGPDGRVRAIAPSASIAPQGRQLDVASLSSWVAANRKAKTPIR